MKYILVLFILIPISLFSQEIDVKNFKVLKEINKDYPSGTKFEFEFEIKGDYTYSTYGYHQIDLRVYKNSVSSDNLLGLIYWNREDDYDIYYSDYTVKSTWLTTWKDFSTYKDQKFYLEVRYAGLSKTYSFTFEPAIKITQVTLPLKVESNMPTFYYDNSFRTTVGCQNFVEENITLRRILMFFRENLESDNEVLNYYFSNGNMLPNSLLYYMPFNSTKLLTLGASFSKSFYINPSVQTIPSSGKYYLYTLIYYDDFGYDYDVEEVYVTSKNKSAIITSFDVSNKQSNLTNNYIVYPNPSNGFFKINFGNCEYDVLKVINPIGQEVHSEKLEGKAQTKVRIDNPIAGIYLVELINGKRKDISKILIK